MGNWSGQVKRGWGPQLPRGAPVGRPWSGQLGALRCFNPPAAAGRNSRAAPVTAKTSTGDDHRSVGDRHLARADVAPAEKSFGNLRTEGRRHHGPVHQRADHPRLGGPQASLERGVHQVATPLQPRRRQPHLLHRPDGQVSQGAPGGCQPLLPEIVQ